LHSSASHAFLPALYEALTSEVVQPSAAILFRRRSNASRDSPLSIYLEVTSRQTFRVRNPSSAVTSPFHSGTPSIPAKPKTLSRQKLRQCVSSDCANIHPVCPYTLPSEAQYCAGGRAVCLYHCCALNLQRKAIMWLSLPGR
jgi:hypothetical protein